MRMLSAQRKGHCHSQGQSSSVASSPRPRGGASSGRRSQGESSHSLTGHSTQMSSFHGDKGLGRRAEGKERPPAGKGESMH